MPKKRGNRPNVDSLLPDVDDDMRHDSAKASSRHGATAPQRHDATEEDADDSESSSRSEETGERRADSPDEQRSEKAGEEGARASAFRQQLDVLMDGPEQPYAADKPELPERTHGYVSGEVDRSLEQAVSVLKNRYGKGFSKSLVVDYALRVALWELRENAEASRLVEWLDRTLARDSDGTRN